jgi:hypothetical protein
MQVFMAKYRIAWLPGIGMALEVASASQLSVTNLAKTTI